MSDGKQLVNEMVDVRPQTFRQFIGMKIAGDQLGTEEDPTQTPGFPWTFAEANKRPIGSMFPLEVTDADRRDMYRRYQLARRIIDDPNENAFIGGPTFFINGEKSEKANLIFKRNKAKWLRFFKLVDLDGHSEMILGWSDPKTLWTDNPPSPGAVVVYNQPVPKFYEVELKETLTIPKKIEYLTVNFGATNLTLHPSRFIHAMNPKLIEEDKQGESKLLPIANLLQVQVHADWSIGQALFRRASGLLGLFAPKRKVNPQEKTDAINSLSNHNSKTVVYIPFQWNVKDILKPGGNLAIARTYKVILEQISAGSGIPVSILIGAQRGQISDEDKATYARLVGAKQVNTMSPTLTKWMRQYQIAGQVEPGEITLDWGTIEVKTELQQAREETEIGALRLLQARMELAAPPVPEGQERTISQPALGPQDKELVKLVSTKK
jgi:hypothetical protein